MKKLIFILALVAVVTGYYLSSCHQKSYSVEAEISRMLIKEVDSFKTSCQTLEVAAKSPKATASQLQLLFLQARLAYKKIEWAAEYFVPVTSRLVNGPPVPEVETSGQVIEAAGLQVIEPILFPNYNSGARELLIGQLQSLQARCESYISFFENIGIFDWQVFDAVKLEVFRIETLGIAGFDDLLSEKSMPESAAALSSLENIVALFLEPGDRSHLLQQFRAAELYLTRNADFNTFDRMEFITRYCDSLTTGITESEAKRKMAVIKYHRLLNQDAKTLYDSNTFNVNAYAFVPNPSEIDKKIALGKLLFYDLHLSKTGARSCASCHQPEKAFTDGLAKNTALGSNRLLQRNTPTLFNAALQPALFYDLRVSSVEEQSREVIQSADEMGGSVVDLANKMWKDLHWRQRFETAFPVSGRTSIDTLELMEAIASYVRSLVALNSRFDAYMRGNRLVLSADEISGFNLFMGKAKCGTCHFQPLFSGNFPPGYVRIESEVIGIPQSLANNGIDSDVGRYDVLQTPAFRHAFKTPTVRNAARTAPYMHNGVFITLEQVLDFYNRGGGQGLGLRIENATLPVNKLNLNEKEIREIIAFIQSLNSN